MEGNLLNSGGGIPNIGGPKIDPLSYPTSKCECGNMIFNNCTVLKEIPGAVIGQAGETILIPISVYVCSKCGKIHREDIKTYKLEEDKKIEL